MKREVELPEENLKIMLAEDEILTIGNDNAITPIQFDDNIISNHRVYDLLTFVTNTSFTRIDGGSNIATKNKRTCEYSVTTGPFNQVAVTRLLGIETE
jgi:hypothetical protein